MGAGTLIPAKELAVGEVGYFTASIKEVSHTRVGDTVTSAEHPAAEALLATAGTAYGVLRFVSG